MRRLIFLLFALLTFGASIASAQDDAIGVPRTGGGLAASAGDDDPFDEDESEGADQPAVQEVEMPDLDAMYDRAARRAQRNDIAGAIEMFEEIYEWDDQWVDPVWNIGNLSEHVDDYQTCALWFRRYLTLAPEASDADDVRSTLEGCEARLEDAGTLDVSTIFPEHAKVSIDGLEILTSENNEPVALLPGDYLISAEGYDHTPWSQTVTITAGETTSIAVELSEIIYYGTLMLEVSEPGAAIRIDGEAVGTSPMTQAVTLAEGEYLVEVLLDGFYPWRRYVQIVKDVDDITPVDLIDESVDLDDL